MPSKYNCFVISRIGNPESPERLQADDAFKYIIKPALEKFGFTDETVLRADHIRGITDTITKEMVERIQLSDLCIVDLTGLNPNVMYECGRRHETGKPCILISQDEKLPFDVITHPVIRYSLEGGIKEIFSTISEIQENVQHFFESGFETIGGKTLLDISREVGAVGQKVDILLRHAVAKKEHVNAAPEVFNAADIVKKLGGVIPALNYAFANSDVDLIDQLLPKAPNKDGDNFILTGLVQGCQLGSKVALDLLEDVIISKLERFKFSDQARIISGYAAGAARLDQGKRALPIVRNLLIDFQNKIEDKKLTEAESCALILNALQRILHSLREYEEAIKIGDQILSISPSDMSYLYNQAMNFLAASREARNHSENEKGQANFDRAVELVDRYVYLMRTSDFDGTDEDHLSLAIKIYLDSGRINDARALFVVLDRNHPLMASMIQADNDYASLFQYK